MATAATNTGQAIGSDPTDTLDLAPNFIPDVDLVASEGGATFGMKGAGKSNALARLVEQLSKFPLPLQRLAQESAPVPKAKTQRKRTPQKLTTEIEDRIYALLEHDSDLSPTERVTRVGCSREVAKKARHDFFSGNIPAETRE
jgi:hypothetical protein